jgi:hypothetical protein
MAHVMRKTKGTGDIFLKTDKELMWVHSLSEEGTNDSVVLQPENIKPFFGLLALNARSTL